MNSSPELIWNRIQVQFKEIIKTLSSQFQNSNDKKNQFCFQRFWTRRSTSWSRWQLLECHSRWRRWFGSRSRITWTSTSSTTSSGSTDPSGSSDARTTRSSPLKGKDMKRLWKRVKIMNCWLKTRWLGCLTKVVLTIVFC